MGRYNEILTGRHGRFFQKLFSMKGPVPVSQVSGDIQPVHPIFHGTENRYLESWLQFGAVLTVGASVGNFSLVRMRNPATSGLIAVVESIKVWNNQSIEMDMSVVAPGVDLTNQFVGIACDGRSGGSKATPTFKSSGLKLSSFAVAAHTGITFLGAQVPASQGAQELIQYEDQALPLTPGVCFEFGPSLVNLPLFISLQWRERPIEESEL